MQENVVVLPVTISVLALLFSALSFWFLHARSGKIVGIKPVTYLCRNSDSEDLLIRLPLVLANSGPVGIVVADLRGHITGKGVDADLEWILERTGTEPEDHGFKDWASPFSIPGHGTARRIVEFSNSVFVQCKLESLEIYHVAIEGYVGHATARPRWAWKALIEFHMFGPADDSRQWMTVYPTVERHVPDSDIELPDGE